MAEMQKKLARRRMAADGEVSCVFMSVELSSLLDLQRITLFCYYYVQFYSERFAAGFENL